MTDFTPISALIGGGFIGLGAVALFLSIGKIAGISGIVSQISLDLKVTEFWRIAFAVGLIIGCLLSFNLLDVPEPNAPTGSTPMLILSGLLVGLGTVIGSGCTSGHGVCGISRFSIRSIVATLIFIGFGMATATLMGG